MIINHAPGGGNVSVSIDGESYYGALTLTKKYKELTAKNTLTHGARYTPVIIDSKIFIFGSSGYVYSITADGTVTQEGSLSSTPIVAFNLGETLYAIVGRAVYAYNSTSKTWSQVSTVPDVGSSSASQYIRSQLVAVYDNAVHLILGWNVSTSNYDYRYHYKWDGTTWTSVSTLPQHAYSASLAVYNSRLYLITGPDAGTKTLYRFNGSSWGSLGALDPYPHSQDYAFYHQGEYLHLIWNYDSHIYHRIFNGTSWTDGEDLNAIPNNWAIQSGIGFNNENHVFNGYPTHYTFGHMYYEEV